MTLEAITEAIREFKFWNYGLNDVDPRSEYAEWVPDLAAAIHKAVADAQVDAQGAPHFGCCPEHDWRGPGRDTADEASEDIRQHETETHSKETSL